ncbi:hypothetical protein M8C21_020227, partial [Ambrosia artemisiifolia]
VHNLQIIRNQNRSAPLGSGFFASGPKLMDNLVDNDLRKIIPRLQGDNFDHNKLVYERVSQMAQRKGCTQYDDDRIKEQGRKSRCVLDTGNIVSRLVSYLEAKGATSVSMCTILDKPARRKVHFELLGDGKFYSDK